MADEEKIAWEDQPWFLRGQVEGALSLAETLVRDYTDCVIDKAIANRRFDENDPEAWAKTVRVLVTNAVILGHTLMGAKELGHPEADELWDRYTKTD